MRVIAPSAAGDLFGLDDQGRVFRLDLVLKSWSLLPGGASDLRSLVAAYPSALDTGSGIMNSDIALYGVNSKNELWVFRYPQPPSATPAPPRCTPPLAIGTDGSTPVVPGLRWEQLTSNVVAVDAVPSGGGVPQYPVALSTAGSMEQCLPACVGIAMSPAPVAMKTVRYLGWDYAFGLGVDGFVYKYSFGGWDKVPGGPYRSMAVFATPQSAVALVMVVDMSGALFTASDAWGY